jgi:hypothetical protein
MNFAVFLLLMCVVCAILGIQRAILNRSEERSSAGKKKGVLSMAPYPPGVETSFFHTRRIAELTRQISPEPDQLIVHLIDPGSPRDSVRWVHGELRLTLDELEERLRWIPPGSRLVIYRLGGIGSSLAQQIGAMAPGRELLLLSGTVLHVTEKPERMVGV